MSLTQAALADLSGRGGVTERGGLGAGAAGRDRHDRRGRSDLVGLDVADGRGGGGRGRGRACPRAMRKRHGGQTSIRGEAKGGRSNGQEERCVVRTDWRPARGTNRVCVYVGCARRWVQSDVRNGSNNYYLHARPRKGGGRGGRNAHGGGAPTHNREVVYTLPTASATYTNEHGQILGRNL